MFTVSTLSVTAVTTVTISASFGGVTKTALLTITPATGSPAQFQNDCGSGGDAGDTLATATPITLPVTCTGALLRDLGDFQDLYTFTVPQAFELLTVSLQNYAGGLGLIDPTGAVRLSAPGGFTGPTPLRVVNGWGVGYTVDTPGQWTLVLGSPLPSPHYTMHIHLGGGGNDCVSGRDPARVPPNVTDAPNFFLPCALCPFPPPPASALPLLGQEISCTGSLTALDFDLRDNYSFPVLAHEPVAVSVLPDLPGSMTGLIQLVNISGVVQPLDTGLGLTQSGSFSVSGSAILQLTASASTWQVPPPTPDLGYRIQVATGAHHNGDAFTGADAGNAFSTATPLPVVRSFAGVGDISAVDREDWYSVTAATNEELIMRSTFAPFEVYDPDGVNRGRGQVSNTGGTGFFMVDKPGDWRIRVATDIAPLPHFEGNYGLSVSRLTGAPGHDCNSGADAPAAGLFLTLPVTCQGDFLPFFDNGDEYLFQLAAGQTVNISMTPNPSSDFNIALKDPNGVQRAQSVDGGVGGTERISFTADFPGTWALQVLQSVQNGQDMWYSFSISASNAATTVSSLALNLTSVTPGTAVQGTVTMNPAPIAPAVVLLSSSNGNAARPDSGTVTVPAGATSATFTVSTPGFVTGQVTLSASFGGVSVTSTLTVNFLQLAGITCNPSCGVTGGAGLQGIVTLSPPPGAPGPFVATSPIVVLLGSGDANVAHPVSGTVTIPAGASSATFNISTAPVAATRVVELFASATGAAQTNLAIGQVTVMPPVAPATLLLSPANGVGPGTVTLTVVGPASSTGTVTLTAPAPAGGAVVVLSSLDPAVAQVPGSVTVPAGATSATFTVMASAVAAPGSATIYASLGGTVLIALLNVSPVPPPPPPPPPPPTVDTVRITLAEYIVSKKQLRVQATSTSTTATLQILVTSTGALIGTLTNNGAGGFSGQLSWPVNPQNITAKSSAGGSTTTAVVAK